MTFEEALRLVEKAAFDGTKLDFEEGMMINHACAIVAMEYVRIKERIMPA